MPTARLLDSLHAQIAQIEGVAARHSVLPFGVATIDRQLPARGIASGALHDVAGSRELADDAAARAGSSTRPAHRL